MFAKYGELAQPWPVHEYNSLTVRGFSIGLVARLASVEQGLLLFVSP